MSCAEPWPTLENTTGAPIVTVVPTDWSIAGVGDFDGNGRADILWRSSAGEVAFWFMNGAAIVSGPSIGVIANDWMISGVADFTGDGKSDILWRHSNGTTGYWQMNGAAATAAPTLWAMRAAWLTRSQASNGAGTATRNCPPARPTPH